MYSKYVTCYDLVETSDIKYKENIRDLESSLDKIKQLNGKKYDFVNPDKSKQMDKIGLIAQEVEKVIPEVVVYDTIKQEYGISYTDLIPILIEAIKEQQTEIESLKIKTDEVKLKSLQVTTDDEEMEIYSGYELSQNYPNPFNENTTISLIIPPDVAHAMLNIYDLQGKQIKSIAISDRGDASVIIEGATLTAGIYYYSLIADGREVATKKMILTD